MVRSSASDYPTVDERHGIDDILKPTNKRRMRALMGAMAALIALTAVSLPELVSVPMAEAQSVADAGEQLGAGRRPVIA